MNIESEIQEWAKKTVIAYNQRKRSYYTQSPLVGIKEDKIELLVLGINPGSISKPFDEWVNDDLWKGKITKNGMTAEILLQGNPAYPNRNKEWSFWKKLRSLLEISGMDCLMDNEKSFVYTNVFLCSTKKEKGISKDDYNNLKLYTFMLIDILKPKRIICLGQNTMDSLLVNYLKKKDNTCKLTGLPIRYKVINEMKVYGFHHPAYYYSNEEKQLVGHFLGHYDKKIITEANPLPKELEQYVVAYLNRSRKANAHGMVSSDEIYKKLCERLKTLYQVIEEKNNLCRFEISKELAFTVTNNENGYVAFRHIKFDKKVQYTNNDYPNLFEYRSTLQDMGYETNSNVWLGKKQFIQYGGNEEDVCNTIIIEINNITLHDCLVKNTP